MCITTFSSIIILAATSDTTGVGFIISFMEETIKKLKTRLNAITEKKRNRKCRRQKTKHKQYIYKRKKISAFYYPDNTNKMST